MGEFVCLLPLQELVFFSELLVFISSWSETHIVRSTGSLFNILISFSFLLKFSIYVNNSHHFPLSRTFVRDTVFIPWLHTLQPWFSPVVGGPVHADFGVCCLSRKGGQACASWSLNPTESLFPKVYRMLFVVVQLPCHTQFFEIPWTTYSMPGSSVFRCLSELAQICVRWVSDAI